VPAALAQHGAQALLGEAALDVAEPEQPRRHRADAARRLRRIGIEEAIEPRIIGIERRRVLRPPVRRRRQRGGRVGRAAAAGGGRALREAA
jgi:hypothetical protein